jgi:hypothetical protein
MSEENVDNSPRGLDLQAEGSSHGFHNQLQLVLDELHSQRQDFQTLRDEVQGKSRSLSS